MKRALQRSNIVSSPRLLLRRDHWRGYRRQHQSQSALHNALPPDLNLRAVPAFLHWDVKIWIMRLGKSGLYEPERLLRQSRREPKTRLKEASSNVVQEGDGTG